jgi:lipoyl(octanoyl) transferase
VQQVQFRNLGLISFGEAWQLQESLLAAITERKKAGKSSENPEHHFLLCQHPPVFTLGKSGKENHLLASPELLRQRGIEFFRINRGGDITFHGPGQWVGYPILDLDYFYHDIHRYMRNLEEVIIKTLADFGIKGGRIEGQTGVWIENHHPSKARKICAFGVRCSRWVTMHGFALNVNTDLDFFNLIVPCGIKDKTVTSMEKELGFKINMAEAENSIKKNFEEVFDAKLFLTANTNAVL